jgi:glycine dehydrogenase subunit 2
VTRDIAKYRAARWNEPLIMEQGSPGERGVIPIEVEEEIQRKVGDVTASLPKKARRADLPNLPEVSQMQVLRHYVRLSQMTLGMDVTPDASSGTCTMKYSPKVNEELARMHYIRELHPLQDEETLQGLLELMYRFNRIMCAISGLDEFSFQPGSGAQGIYTNACIIRAYHESKGQIKQRNEVISTAFSHPSDEATPHVAGFKVITLMPGERGYPDLESLKAALSNRTAGFMVTNPEDTGLFNPHMGEMVRLVKQAGGLCAYDQANANGILGISRAADVGFDMCQFNLHKTFSAPHGAVGLGCAAVGVRKELAKFLPKPVITFDGKKYHLDNDRPESIGKIRSFMGNVQTALKSYAWVMALGPDGIRSVAETAVLNNNYLAAKVTKIKGVELPWDPKVRRLEQIRYSWAKLLEDTGVSTGDMSHNLVAYGLQQYMQSHVPRLVDEPMTLEPSESLSLDDLDEYASALKDMSDKAYKDPETFKGGPYNGAVNNHDDGQFNDPKRWAMTYKAYQRKRGAAAKK